jgi:hypothetical protein
MKGCARVSGFQSAVPTLSLVLFSLVLHSFNGLAFGSNELGSQFTDVTRSSGIHFTHFKGNPRETLAPANRD